MKKLFVISILLILILSCFFTINTVATLTDTNIENFDSSFLYGACSNSWMSSNYHALYFRVDDIESYSGVQSFTHYGNYNGGSVLGYWGMFYINVNNITEISYNFRFKNVTGDASNFAWVQLEDIDGIGNGLAIYGSITGANDMVTIEYHDANPPYNKIPFAAISADYWYNARITFSAMSWNMSIYNKTGNVFMGGHTFSYTRGAVFLNMSSFTGISFGNIYTGNTENVFQYYDDLSITYNGTGTGTAGGLLINAFNETSNTGIGFDVSIFNDLGTLIYTENDCVNTHWVNFTDMSIISYNVTIVISNDSYDTSRTYNAVLISNMYRTLNAYLPYTAELYLLNVVGPPSDIYENPPLEDVNVLIKGLIGTSYQNVSNTYTDSNGQTLIYLVPGHVYTVKLSKTNYVTRTEYYIPSSTVFTYTFRMSYNDSSWNWTNPYLCNEEITFNGYINRTSKKLYLNYTDDLNKTINTKIITYEYRNNFSNATLFNTNSKTGNSSFQINFTINNSRSYNCIIYVNHTHCGYFIRSIYFPANRTTITNQSRFELLFVLNYGSNPFGWSNTFMWLIMVACLFSFGRRETYMSAILCGFVFLFINYSIGFYTAMSVGTGVGIPILFIVMGVLMIYRDRGYIG